ncbi:putative Secretin_N domain-containing protein [Gammaproteobacteria bacterium]
MSKVRAGRRKWRTVVAGACLVGLLGGQGGWAADIPWRSEPFERSVVDEDLQDVLSRLLRQNDSKMVVIFKPGISGKVTTDFRAMNIPLQGAFNKLMEENSLSYSYDPASNNLTVFPTLTSKRDLISLRYMSPGEVKAALGRFGMLSDRVSVTPDVTTNSLLVYGTTQAVSEVANTVAKLEAGAAERQKNEENTGKIRENDAKLRESDAKLREQTVLMRERELRVKCAEEQAAAQMSRQVEVIPVRYASVGSTTLTFQGEKVSVPGMDETLRALMDEPANKSPARKGGETEQERINDRMADRMVDRMTASSTVAQSSSSVSCGSIKPILSTDLRTNSVIVQAPPDVIADVKKMVQALDKPMPLIDLEVMIVQAEAGTSRNLGVQWGAAASDRNGNAGGISTGAGAGALAAGAAGNIASFYGTPMSNGSTSILNTTGTTLSSSQTASGPGYSNSAAYIAQMNSVTGNISGYQQTTANSTTPITDPITLLPLAGGPGSGLLSYVFQGTRGALAAQLNALKQQNKSQVLASPHVVTLNNILAKITSKRKVSIPITTGDGTRSDIKTVDAGLEMHITPSLIREDAPGVKQMVRLNIDAKNSSFTAALQTDEKEVQSNVIVPDGSTFILGGLFQDNHLEGDSGVLGLMDIPVIGGLFRSKNADMNRSETIFFITPKLVDHKTLTAYDVGTRDYMYHQKASLEQDRRSLQAHPGSSRRMVEDE